MNPMPRSRTRRSFIQLGLSAGLALIAAGAGLPGHDANAGKKKKSAQTFNQAQKDLCETLGGGTLEVRNMGDGRWETDCHGGEHDGLACTNTDTSQVCVKPLQNTGSGGWNGPLTNPGSGPFQPLEPGALQTLAPFDVNAALATYETSQTHRKRGRGRRRRRR